MHHSLSHRLLILLLAFAMQLCCCPVQAFLATGGCGASDGPDAAAGHCCCRKAKAGSDQDRGMGDGGASEQGQSDRELPDGCPCELAFVKAPAAHHGVVIPAPEIVAVLPFAMPRMVALAVVEEPMPCGTHAPPERPGGRLALDRFNRRLI